MAGGSPGMREWIGDREVQNLSGSDYTIKNKSWELTFGIPREAVEDDKIGSTTPASSPWAGRRRPILMSWYSSS